MGEGQRVFVKVKSPFVIHIFIQPQSLALSQCIYLKFGPPRPAGEPAQQDVSGSGQGAVPPTPTSGGAMSPRKTSKTKPKKSLTRYQFK